MLASRLSSSSPSSSSASLLLSSLESMSLRYEPSSEPIHITPLSPACPSLYRVPHPSCAPPRMPTSHTPPWRQPRGKWVVSLVNSHTNTTRIGWHLWEINLRFAPGLPPGWRTAGGGGVGRQASAACPHPSRRGRPRRKLADHKRILYGGRLRRKLIDHKRMLLLSRILFCRACLRAAHRTPAARA